MPETTGPILTIAGIRNATLKQLEALMQIILAELARREKEKG